MYQEIAPSLGLLYDQSAPVGRLGRGTHYSVFRGVLQKAQPPSFGHLAEFLDFAVVWDEDHDKRVLAVVERMYLEGLLWPVRFIGERKGCLHVILSEAAFEDIGPRGIEEFRQRVAECCRVDGDVWSVFLSTDGSGDSPIIVANAASVATFLANIDLLWNLGAKPAELA